MSSEISERDNLGRLGRDLLPAQLLSPGRRREQVRVWRTAVIREVALVRESVRGALRQDLGAIRLEAEDLKSVKDVVGSQRACPPLCRESSLTRQRMSCHCRSHACGERGPRAHDHVRHQDGPWSRRPASSTCLRQRCRRLLRGPRSGPELPRGCCAYHMPRVGQRMSPWRWRRWWNALTA